MTARFSGSVTPGVVDSVAPGSIALEDHSMRRVHGHVEARLASRTRINSHLLEDVFAINEGAAERLREIIETTRSLIFRSMAEQRELLDLALDADPEAEETQLISRWLMRHGAPTPQDPRSRRVISVLEHRLNELDAAIATAFLALDYCAVDLSEVDPEGPVATTQLNDAAKRLSTLVDVVKDQADAASVEATAAESEQVETSASARRAKPRRAITPGAS